MRVASAGKIERQLKVSQHKNRVVRDVDSYIACWSDLFGMTHGEEATRPTDMRGAEFTGSCSHFCRRSRQSINSAFYDDCCGARCDEGIAARGRESLLLDKQQEVLSRPTGAKWGTHKAGVGLP